MDLYQLEDMAINVKAIPQSRAWFRRRGLRLKLARLGLFFLIAPLWGGNASSQRKTQGRLLEPTKGIWILGFACVTCQTTRLISMVLPFRRSWKKFATYDDPALHDAVNN